jgi:hypothetical protein
VKKKERETRKKGEAMRRGRAIQEKFDSLCKGPLTGAGGLVIVKGEHVNLLL